MIVILEISLGSLLLILCAIVHIAIVTAMINFLRRHQPSSGAYTKNERLIMVAGLFAVSLVSHTLHIYIWAIALRFVGALQTFEEQIYYALVTYTTVGYGDVVVEPGFRILGAMASVTGILMFGMTTAFLVGVFSRVLGEKDI
jgi:hypothetical protein